MGKTYRCKLFQNGGSQAIRLPKECRFPEEETEVLVHKEGDRLILERSSEWSPEFLAALGSCPDFARPPQPRLSEVTDPFTSDKPAKP